MDDADAADRETAEPITAVIADRVRSLRRDKGMSQDDLAQAMDGPGVRWTRATVGNLERRSSKSRATGGERGRDSISVQELLRLAVALEVPAIWLLVDMKDEGPVPIAKDVELDPWSALLWAVGRSDLSGDWAHGSKPLNAIYRVAEIVTAFQSARRERLAAQAVDPRWEDNKSADDSERHRLSLLVDPLHYLAIEKDYCMPALPVEVTERARELGVRLPGQVV